MPIVNRKLEARFETEGGAFEALPRRVLQERIRASLETPPATDEAMASLLAALTATPTSSLAPTMAAIQEELLEVRSAEMSRQQGREALYQAVDELAELLLRSSTPVTSNVHSLSALCASYSQLSAMQGYHCGFEAPEGEGLPLPQLLDGTVLSF